MIIHRGYTKIKETFWNRHFFKFILVGILATILNYGTFYAMYKFMSVSYLISSSVGYIAGVLLGFYINKNWSFEAQSKKYIPTIIKYFIVYLISMFMGLVILKVLVSVFKFNPLIANVAIIGFTTITNFLGTKFFVFSEFRKKDFNFIIYRYRFLLNYIIIGFSSIVLEIIIMLLLKKVVTAPLIVISIMGFVPSMIFSYYINSKLNFKVPKEKNLKTFQIFVAISVGSYILNLVLYKILGEFLQYEYYYLRFLTAAVVFTISYTLHRQYTFVDIKYVGIAVYLRADEDIDKIWSKIQNYPDFIHLDIVDKTFNPEAKEVDLAKGYELKQKWIGIKTMTHIMSKNPSKYLDKVADFSDIIIIHTNIDEDPNKVIDRIIELKKAPGICLAYNDKVSNNIQYFKKIKMIQLLGIKHAGISGQNLEKDALNKLKQIERYKKKYNLDICFDGGIKMDNISRVNAKYIVSASSLLESANPIKALYDLKTSSRYFQISESMKNNIKSKILGLTKKIKSIESLNIVGSYADKNDLEDVSDIDVIIIIDELTKEKFREIISAFEEIKISMETDYDIKVKINDTFGPLKFDDEYDVVFHVMVYDIKSHLQHCIKSPFTVLDWERTKMYEKKHMSEICKTILPQPNQLINSRRSIETYISDLKNKSITYRRYAFKDGKITEMQLNKKFENKDKLEYMYHAVKFMILNFVKIHKRENIQFNKDTLAYFHETTKINKDLLNFFYDLSKRKISKKIKIRSDDMRNVKSFLYALKDFHEKYYFTDSKKIIFIRHNNTHMNTLGMFLGQRMDPGIEKVDSKKLGLAKELTGKCDLIYSSPLKRAIETTREIFHDTDKEIIINSLLKEIDYGLMDGKNIDYLKKNYPQMIKSWAQDKDPRFPEGENYADVKKRLDKFMDILRSKEFSKAAVITHNVVLRVLIGEILQIPQNLWHKIQTDHLECFEVLLCDNNCFYLNVDKEKMEKIYREVYSHE